MPEWWKDINFTIKKTEELQIKLRPPYFCRQSAFISDDDGILTKTLESPKNYASSSHLYFTNEDIFLFRQKRYIVKWTRDDVHIKKD